MEDIDYGALFGIEESGAEETEPAEPSEDANTEGEKEQEVAEPAEEKAENEAESSDEDAAPAEHTDPDEPEQTPEERSRFAAARRKAEAERDAAIEKAKAEAQRTIDEAFANCGLTNPYTKQPITSKAEYDAYRARFEAEKKAQILKKSGMTDEEFNRFVESLPEVQQAKQAKEQAEAAALQAREQQAKLKIEEQLKEISALDPSVKELGDLAKMENYPQFYELVRRGNSLTDAFKLANYDMLTKNAAAASKQAALNAAKGKEHLSQTTARGAGAATVPADVKEAYRAFNPNATDAEIQQHYNKYLKK